MSEEKKKYAPLLPYDVTVRDDFSMYDRFDYQNNRDKTGPLLKKTETGNIVKYYTTKVAEKPTKIDYNDSEDKK